MADDGMLLNFEIGDAPLQSQVKFKGGKWRDRVRAQKSVKRWQAKPTATESAATSESRATAAADALHRSERPAKRQRLDGRARSGNVTSRLFSSIPLPITAMDGAPAEAAEAEAAEPSNAPLSSEAETFLALGLSGRIAQHLSSKLEMRAPTSIQKNTIPQLIKEDSDAFLQAETGSGKTLAYLLPIVQRILALSLNDDGTTKDVKIHRNSGLFALILGPTRELCKQIATVAEKVFRCAPWLVSTTVIGGESKKSEKARIRKGINILIATPGRLADHLANTKVLDVGTVRWLVLDEGDRMMEMGFEEDLRTIVSKIRQNPLCSTNSEGLYDSVLQKGFASAVHLPTPADEEEAGTSERQTWKDRAEALQLHLEQRLLATAPTTEETAGDPPKKSFRAAKDGQGARWPAKPKDSALLDSSRNAFRSHIRAYATHVKEERECFDISQLHLGHVAKSFGLREAPGGIGGGVSRRTHKGPPGGSTPQQKGGAGGRKRPAAGSDEGVPGVGSAMDDVAVVDDAAVKRMKAKMKAVMNASSEFNIG
ncbi:hypothetical protein P8C59_005508 [Phyllachora maydis]|uniref:ATP-dependent RNA helicase n=1 Tax=Phyllachora maydis TaxID=1825666 RepID=A0AAD9MBI4_9PEZI|nr:hypothetical protein P8C59_005508 [Phyllachora maydis]